MNKWMRALVPGLMLLLSACDNKGSSATDPGGDPADPGTPPPVTGCTNPLPAGAFDRSLVVNSPSDSDASTNPTPTSTIYFTVLLPERCPGAGYPLVLHSHGYGGKRLRSLAATGSLPTSDPHFPSIDALTQALPRHGYAVISVDQRGHGESAANTKARIIDPALEIQDLRRILDWAYDNAAAYNFQTETGTGIDRDLKVGTIGYSYGGGYQMTLAALDPRIDTIVPNGTWNNLLYSLLPGDGVKLGFDGLLCLLGATGGVENTPIVAALCNQVGVQNLFASTVRTRDDLVAALGRPLTQPRTIDEAEVNPFFYSHSTRYFETQQAAGQPWGFGETSASLRRVPALFLQGNRDVLFNLTEAKRNADYFAATGADVRLLSTEGGHMNPLANQIEGTANCGTVIGLDSILAWYDHWLKGVDSAAFDGIPKVCISVADTVSGQPGGTPAGLALDAMPVGSQTGAGGVPARLETATVNVGALLSSAPTFVPVTTITGSGRVLAGVPRLSSISVVGGPNVLPRAAIALVGVGIRRNGSLILVDDQVTSFVEGLHTFNRSHQNSIIELPAIGEQLQDGDQVGLLFYEQQVQYAAILSAISAPNLTNVVNVALGTTLPAFGSALDGSLLAAPNPYDAVVTGIELPILIPAEFPGASLRR